MSSPSDIAKTLILIADKIDNSKAPSISRVASSLKNILANMSENITITNSSCGEFYIHDNDRNSATFACRAKHIGTWDGKPLELEYTMYLNVTHEEDADEDGKFMNTGASSEGYSGDYDTDAPSIKVDGVELIHSDSNSDLEDALEIIPQSEAFLKADSSLVSQAEDDVKRSDAMANWKYDLADSAAYDKDPYSYYGVKRSDFL